MPCSGVGTSWYLQSVKMWNELSIANRNGCYWVVGCSLLRSNNKIRGKSVSGSGGTEGGVQDKNGKRGQSSNHSTWPGPWVNHSVFKYFCQDWSQGCDLLMLFYCAYLSVFAHAWSASKAPCGFCYASLIICFRVLDQASDLCPASQL